MTRALTVALWLVLFGMLVILGYVAANWLLTVEFASPTIVPEDEADSVRFRCVIRAGDHRISCEERD